MAINESSADTKAFAKVAKTEKQLAAQRVAAKRYRRKQREKKEAAAEAVVQFQEQQKATEEEIVVGTPAGKEAVANILRSAPWNLSNPNVISQCFANGKDRAQLLGVTPDLSYWVQGVDFSLVSDELGGRSEVLTYRELYALYQFTAAGLKILEIEVDFESWLQLRDRVRKDLWWLATVVLRIPLVESVHRELTEEFYPKLNCDGLFTKEGYSIVQMQAAIVKQFEDIPNELMLFDAREYMKTALASVFVLQFLSNFPDARVFDISGTDDLAAGFLRIMKGYLGHTEGAEFTTFNLLFPEYTLRGKDATSDQAILLPCRRFFQKDFSFESFGVMGAASGRHADLFVGDDVVQAPGTEDTREKLKNRADTLSSNIPGTGMPRLWLGTRYHEEDYYSHKIKIWEEDPTSMRFLTHGVLTPKDGCEHIPVQDLIFDPDDESKNQVILRWRDKGGSATKNWRELKRKMRVNPVDFMFQQMNCAIPFDDNDNKVSFDSDMLSNRIVEPFWKKTGELYLQIDIAWGHDNRADYTAFVVGRIAPSTTDPELSSCYLEHIKALRSRSSETAQEIVDLCQKFTFNQIIIERIGGADAIIDEARRLATQSGVTLPYIWAKKVVNTPGIKWRRIKQLELYAGPQSRLWFSQDIDPMALAMTLEQFSKYTGKRSTTRRDDIPDAIALLCENVLPKIKEDEATKRALSAAQEAADEKDRRQREYDMHFGPSTVYGVQTNLVAEEDDPVNRYIHPAISKKPPKFLSFADAPLSHRS